MKTYSRKKSGEPQEEIIVDLNDVCRLCMEKEDELISIFNNVEPIPLTLRIMACVALEVFEGDGLPDKICHPCKFQLEKSYNFRKKCENSDMKLRQHLKEFKEKMGEAEEIEYEEVNQSMEADTSERSDLNTSTDIVEAGPSTEEDLVGITRVTYIHPEPEPDNNPEDITLLPETDQTVKEACTLDPVEGMKEEVDTEGEEGSNVFVIEETDQSMDDTNMDAIADAVKATLASQSGLNLSGQLQLKVNQTDGKSTQVVVTAEDGSVIVMELMMEEETAPLSLSTDDRTDMNDDGEMKIFQCPECPRAFARRIQLRRHASVHMQQRGFSCGICEKWFPTRSALIRHERIHTGERPFQCEVCQKSFAQKEILFRHLMTHTGQKPYSCPHCPKGFIQKEPLRVHMRTHLANRTTDIQLHYCSLCPKVFCHASGLSRHLVMHTGKTFKCSDCDKSFTDKSSLRRHHLQTNHRP